jgi:hypothetical protein
MAGHRFGANSRQQQEVGNAWAHVGIHVAPATPAGLAAITPSNGQLTYKLRSIATQDGDAVKLAGA